MSVSEAASALGLREARVRRMLGSEQLAGRKVGGMWIVEAAAVRAAAGARRPVGRPMAPAMARAMVDLVGQHLGAPAGADWGMVDSRGRARLRVHLDRLLVAADPAVLLRAWLPHRGERRAYVFRGDLADLLGDSRLAAGGANHPELPLSGGPCDLHVHDDDAEAVIWDHLLVADLAGNVIVHREPVIRVDLAACLVDIAQSGGDRNDAVVAEVLSR